MGFVELARGAWLEGMALDGDVVWASDVIGGGVHRFFPDGTRQTWRDRELWIGAILVNDDGRIISTGAGGIRWFDPVRPQGGTLLGSSADVTILGVNEMAPDDHGGVIFGTVDIPAFNNKTVPSPACLYHLAPDGTLAPLVDDLKFTNGLAFSADRRQLYHCETFVGVFAYDWNGSQLSGRRLLLQKDDCDGMKVDVEGRIWVTGFRSGELTIISPAGGAVGSFAFPGEGATNLWFGGADGRAVYITTVAPVPVSDPSEVKIPGQQDSRLIQGRSDVAGLPVPQPKFQLA